MLYGPPEPCRPSVLPCPRSAAHPTFPTPTPTAVIVPHTVALSLHRAAVLLKSVPLFFYSPAYAKHNRPSPSSRPVALLPHLVHPITHRCPPALSPLSIARALHPTQPSFCVRAALLRVARSKLSRHGFEHRRVQWLSVAACALAFIRYSFTSRLVCTNQPYFHSPAHLQCLPWCNTIARLLDSIRLPFRPPVCMLNTIQYW